MATNFETLRNIIHNRRTTKPNLFSGRLIPDEQINQLLELADWAPTHAHTEPWRFKVFGGDKVRNFCYDHANLYQQHTEPERFMQGTYDKLLHMGDLASHVIIAIMQRGSNPKIPVLEEIASTSCAVQNLLLGATALGIASYWGSGGMAYLPPMKSYLKLREEDLVLGIIYLGYSEKTASQGIRKTPLTEKIDWQWIE